MTICGVFQSTPPVKAATDFFWFNGYGNLISIHAAREGGDCQGLLDAWLTVISIHAAREGGDPNLRTQARRVRQFQSTPPVKAATVSLLYVLIIHREFQSTPPVKVATKISIDLRFHYPISIHAAREGGDAVLGGHTNSPEVFQSTPPVKAATPLSAFCYT